ncbi:MAG: transposase [Janthinobacterium lividum]
MWSWDITKLRGPQRGVYYDCYVIFDIYSRYVVGFTVAARETGEIAEDMIAGAVARHGRPRSLHADRGTSMTSKPVAQLLVDLGVDRTHSRPPVSNDNPYSEAAFKTLKYVPVFPDRFGCLTDARHFCERFFDYYNHQHHHSGLGWHTPASVHDGTAQQICAQRGVTLDAAYQANATRFTRRPQPPELPQTAWINQPSQEALVQTAWTPTVSTALTFRCPGRPSAHHGRPGLLVRPHPRCLWEHTTGRSFNTHKRSTCVEASRGWSSCCSPRLRAMAGPVRTGPALSRGHLTPTASTTLSTPSTAPRRPTRWPQGPGRCLSRPQRRWTGTRRCSWSTAVGSLDPTWS